MRGDREQGDSRRRPTDSVGREPGLGRASRSVALPSVGKKKPHCSGLLLRPRAPKCSWWTVQSLQIHLLVMCGLIQIVLRALNSALTDHSISTAFSILPGSLLLGTVWIKLKLAGKVPSSLGNSSPSSVSFSTFQYSWHMFLSIHICCL